GAGGAGGAPPADAGKAPTCNAQLALGELHSCVLEKGTGTITCWGDNSSGQLGDPTNAADPQSWSLAGASSIASSRNHTCAIAAGGVVACWGVNTEGQVLAGAGNIASVTTLTGLSEPMVEVVAARHHTCARGQSGTIWCWGSNALGE